MDTSAAFHFLRALKKHNNREWFHAHRVEYRQVKEDFENFVDELLREVSSIDPALSDVEPKDCIFRLFRDVRFSKDKSPYKTHLGAFLSPGGRKSGMPGYYFHLSPDDGSLAAGGIWMPQAGALARIRGAILQDAEPLIRILERNSFRRLFPGGFDRFQGASLKTAPKGINPNHQHIDLLRLKSFSVSASLSDDDAQAEDLVERLVGIFEELKPLNDWMAHALKRS